VVFIKVGCEVGRWLELAQDRVQWWALVFLLCWTFGFFYQRIN